MFNTKTITAYSHLFFKKKILLFIIPVLLFNPSFSQNFTQTVKGKVIDKDSRIPLWGANVVIIGTNPAQGTSTDSLGKFRIENVLVGRRSIKVSFLGYEELVIHEFLVGTGKEVILNVELQESVVKLKEVNITGFQDKNKVINSMATVSARSFSIEESQRYAGGFNDLSRMAQSFAGVSSFNGQTNEIVIRGNSPRGLLWRVEGIEVSNPNHFPQGQGSSGGGISIITSDVITNSDFFTAAFPAEYGNALSGVFDINLRKGNDDKHEFALQTGFIGLEALAEGPVSKKNSSSYLINYRLSTLILLNKLGYELVDNTIVPQFHDITFNLYFPTKKLGNFSLFGIGGFSSAGEESVNDSTKWLSRSDRFEETELHRMSVAGLKHFYLFGNNKTYIKNILSVNWENNSFIRDSLDNAYKIVKYYEEEFIYSTFRSSHLINHKFNPKHSLRSGIIYNLLGFNLTNKGLYSDSMIYGELLNSSGNTHLIQGYSQWKYRINSKLELSSGFHFTYFALNDNYSIEPRLGMKWKLLPRHSLNAGLGFHSKLEALSIYFAEIKQNDGTISQLNKNLSLTKAIHAVMGYDYLPFENTRLKAEIYYQFLYDVPIENNLNSQFSTLNYSGGILLYDLINDGKGFNYGIELTIEKFYSKNYYYLLTASLFDSKYEAGDGKLYNTIYNGNYVINLLGGKDFKLGKNKTSIFGINSKFLIKGGNRIIPIDLEKSIESGYPIYKTDETYQPKAPYFLRLDLGISFRRNKVKYAWIISFDIQNVTDRKNVFTEYYDNEAEKIREIYGLRFIPLLNYRLEF